MGLGMKIRETTIMTSAAINTHWMVVGNTIKNWSKYMKYGWNTVILYLESSQICLRSRTTC